MCTQVFIAIIAECLLNLKSFSIFIGVELLDTSCLFFEKPIEKMLQSLDIWMRPHDGRLGNSGICTQQIERYIDAKQHNWKKTNISTIQILMQRNERKSSSGYHISRTETTSSSTHASQTWSPRF